MPGPAYTKKEDNVIIGFLREYPNNIKYACKLASNELNRTPHAIEVHYYKKLKNSNVNILAIGSNKGIMINTKNTSIKKKEEIPDEFCNDMLKVYVKHVPKDIMIQFFMDNMSINEKKKVLTNIMRKIRS